MRYFIAAVAAALLLTPVASAARQQATIAYGTAGTYDVTFTGKKNDNQYNLWVAQTCADEFGVTTSAEYHSVIWNDATGTTDAFTATGTTCSAFVAEFPDVWTPVSNVLVFSTTSALAAKPGLGSASITLDQSAVTLGDTLTFTTEIPKLVGGEYPMIDVQCYQDVNGDGTTDTNLLGPDIVFSELDHPDATFTLGGYSSIWTLRGGGPATCLAFLDAFKFNGAGESVRVLDSTSFDSL